MREKITRRQIEEAVVETAWCYYLKGTKVQYDSQEMNCKQGTNQQTLLAQAPMGKYYLGAWRTSEYSCPENATSDSSVFTVCSDYCWNSMCYATGYPVLGYRLNSITAALWALGEYVEDMMVMRVKNSNYLAYKNSPIEVMEQYGITEKHMMTVEEGRAFLKDWEHHLRPGDWYTSTTHVMLYIGHGYVLDSWGGKYNMTSGVDTYERKGSVFTLHRFEDIALDGTDPVIGNAYALKDGNEAMNFCAVYRPINNLVEDAGTGDPGDDTLKEDYVLPERPGILYPENVKRTGFGITPEAFSRLRFPGMEIDRTQDVGPFATAVYGDIITYHTVVSNRSSNPKYREFKEAVHPELAPYAGDDYTGIKIVETVPEGCELYRAAQDCAYESGRLTWTADIPAGSSRDFWYAVRVVGKPGTVIVNDAGMVDDIPSNRLECRIGCSKLDFKKAAAAARGWKKETVPADAFDFVRKYYEKAGASVSLPDADALTEALFEIRDIHVEHGYFKYYRNSFDVRMFERRKDAAEPYGAMLVDGYSGGVYLHTDRFADKRIMEFSYDYLQPGDILVYRNYELQDGVLTGKASETEVYVYTGNDLLLGIDREKNVFTEIKSADVLWKAHIYDLFYAVRPGQASELL